MIRSAPLEEFYELYENAIQIPVENQLEGFHERVRSVQSSLVFEFESMGLVENVDFVIGWDCGPRYFVCGSITDIRHVSKNVIAGILRSIARDREPESWTCHFCVEDPDSPIGNQFFVNALGELVVKEGPRHEVLLKRLESLSPD